MEEKRSEQELVRIAKLEKYKELGIDPFGSKYDATHHSTDVKDLANKEIEKFKAEHQGLSDEELKEQLHQFIEEQNITVSVAGRIMFIRKMGKASFFAMQDKMGKIQVYIRKDVVLRVRLCLHKLAKSQLSVRNILT